MTSEAVCCAKAGGAFSHTNSIAARQVWIRIVMIRVS